MNQTQVEKTEGKRYILGVDENSFSLPKYVSTNIWPTHTVFNLKLFLV